MVVKGFNCWRAYHFLRFQKKYLTLLKYQYKSMSADSVMSSVFMTWRQFKYVEESGNTIMASIFERLTAVKTGVSILCFTHSEDCDLSCSDTTEYNWIGQEGMASREIKRTWTEDHC
jgi:hypothetical protein